MSTQLYRITATGAQHVRWEWPNGEPVKGSRTESRDGRFVPIAKHGGPAQKVTYGTHRVDRNTGLPVPGVRCEIRLTPEGAKALGHMGLVPIVGSGGGKTESAQPQGANGDNGQDDGKTGEPDATVKVPDGWRDLSESRKRGLAAKIAGLAKDDVTAEQAVSIIEAHLAAGASNAG